MNGEQSLITVPSASAGGITLKSREELELMRAAGSVVGRTIERLESAVAVGIRTRQLDDIAAQEIRRLGGLPAFKGYQGFPATICVSVNNEIVHGIPGDRALEDGDLVSLDVGAIVEGFYGDAAVTVGVGSITHEAKVLIEVTRQALEQGIMAARTGARIGDVSAAVQRYIEGQGEYGIVREYVGHGIGRALHEDPQVPNFGVEGRGVQLREGMAIAIEPMVNLGDCRTRLLEDKWTVVTADGSLSAHFEHTIAIIEGEAQVLTIP